jgi:hypothetical protein
MMAPTTENLADFVWRQGLFGEPTSSLRVWYSQSLVVARTIHTARFDG